MIRVHESMYGRLTEGGLGTVVILVRSVGFHGLVWGTFWLVFGAVYLWGKGQFDGWRLLDVAIWAAGFGMALKAIALSFGRELIVDSEIGVLVNAPLGRRMKWPLDRIRSAEVVIRADSKYMTVVIDVAPGNSLLRLTTLHDAEKCGELLGILNARNTIENGKGIR